MGTWDSKQMKGLEPNGAPSISGSMCFNDLEGDVHLRLEPNEEGSACVSKTHNAQEELPDEAGRGHKHTQSGGT